MVTAGDRRRLLLVHAHPDDESIGTGATMARYAAEGAGVTLVTCTLGELGEVIPADLAHLAAGEGQPGPDRLGRHRIGELARACAALGVSDHRFLGGPGRWRDSGMMGLPSNQFPGCFWQADLDEAAAELAGRDPRRDAAGDRHLRRQRLLRPSRSHPGAPGEQAGGPVAADPAAAPPGGRPWQVAKFYATAMPRSVLAGAIRLGPAGPAGFRQAGSVAELPFGVPDEQVTTEIDGTGFLAAKIAALRSHATQIAVDGPFFALSDMVGQRIDAREYFTLLAGPLGPRASRHRAPRARAGPVRRPVTARGTGPAGDRVPYSLLCVDSTSEPRPAARPSASGAPGRPDAISAVAPTRRCSCSV